MKNCVVFALLFASAAAFAVPDTPGYLGGRVLNGQDAEPHIAPYIIQLVRVSPEFGEEHNCGAVILNSRWVLTTAHCLREPESIAVIAGQHDLRTIEAWEQRRFVERSYTHESHSGALISTSDIGLIYVNQPFVFNQFVQPIMLPGFEQMPTGIGRVFGWALSQDTLANVLQFADKTILDTELCQLTWSPIVDTNNLCAGPFDGSISACPADTGGPMVQFDVNGEPIVVGLVSWGPTPCGWPAPDVYVRVSAFVDWIFRTVGLIDSEIN